MNYIKKILLLTVIALIYIPVQQVSSQTGWVTAPSFTSKNLNCIGQTAVYNLYLAADSGTIYKSTNNGDNWTVFFQDTTEKKLRVRYLTGRNNDDWNAVGDSGLYMYKSGTTVVSGRVVTSPNLVKPNLHAWTFLQGYFNYQTEVAAGDSGLVYLNSSGWRKDTAATRLAAGRRINSSRGVILVGDGGLIMKADSIGFPVQNGERIYWKVMPSGTTQNLYGVFVSSVNYTVVGANGTILTSTNSGETWNVTSSPTTEDLYYAHLGFASIICGANGTILKSTSSGSWFRQATPVTDKLNTLFALGYQLYIALGDNGRVLKTTDGGGPPLAINIISNEVPAEYSLSQNYPNPFNPETNINFSLPVSGHVKITVYDITGSEIDVLVNENLNAGEYKTDFDASGLTSGVYIYKMETGTFTNVRKMILIK